MNAILAGCRFNLRKFRRSLIAFVFGWFFGHRPKWEDMFLPLCFTFDSV